MRKYILGSEKEFVNFVNSISKEEKIGVATHVDQDGIASAIFLQKILESKGLKISFLEFLNHGAGVLNSILEKEFDVLFFTDFSAEAYPEDLDKLRKKGKVLVFDHHPFDENLENKKGIIKTDSVYCSTHALFDIAKSNNYFDTNPWEWLAASTIVAEYIWDKSDENFEFVKSVYPEVKKDSSIWSSEAGRIVDLIGNALIYYQPDFRKVYDLVLNKDLKKLAEADKIVSEEIENWVNKFKEESEYFSEEKLRFYFANPKYRIISKVASIVSSKYFPEDSVVFVSDSISKKYFVQVSSRNQSGNVDLGKLLKKCTEGFKDSSAGGHVRAAAGNFPKKYLDEFKKRLLRELS